MRPRPWGHSAHDPQTAPPTGRTERTHRSRTRRPHTPTARRFPQRIQAQSPKQSPAVSQNSRQTTRPADRANAGIDHRRPRNRPVPPKPPRTTIAYQHQSAAARHDPSRLRNRTLPPLRHLFVPQRIGLSPRDRTGTMDVGHPTSRHLHHEPKTNQTPRNSHLRSLLVFQRPTTFHRLVHVHVPN